MNLESEKRYYLGWAVAFMAIAVGIVFQVSYSDMELSSGVFFLLIGMGMVIVAFIPKYEALTLGSGGAFIGTGAILLVSRYSGGNFWNGVAIIFAIVAVILLIIGFKKEW